MLSGWWRLPFLLSLPLGFVGIWIRLRLEDSPQFRKLEESGQVAKAPLVEFFQKHKAPLLKTLGLSVLLFAGYYVVYVYMAIYLQRSAGFSSSAAFWSTTATIAVSCAAMPAFGALSDRVGRKPVFIGSAVSMLVLLFPAFAVINSGDPVLATVSHVLLGLPESASMAVAFSAFAELFTARVRYTGIALGFNLASMSVGGTAPYISTYLIDRTGDILSPAYFLAAAAVVTLLTALTLKETAGTALRET